MLVFTNKYQLVSTKSNKCIQLLDAGCASLPMGIPVAKPPLPARILNCARGAVYGACDSRDILRSLGGRDLYRSADRVRAASWIGGVLHLCVAMERFGAAGCPHVLGGNRPYR